MKRSFSSCVWLAAVAATLWGAAARAADPGAHFLGLPRASPAEADAFSAVLNKDGGSAAVSNLTDFNPSNPFGNLTRVVHAVAPKISGHLDLELYLKFDHTFVNNLNADPFWEAWQAAQPTKAQQKIRDDYLVRVNGASQFIHDTQAWATANRVANRITYTVIPELEDTCPAGKKQAFTRIVDAITASQKQAGATPSAIRRSCVGSNIFRVAQVALEMHGKWSDVRGHLNSGDAWSPDGYEYPTKDYLADQKSALAAGVTCLYWTAAYNGALHSSDPDHRTVDPFTGFNAAADKAALLSVLQGK